MKATWMEQWIGPAARVLLVVLLGLFLNVPVLAAAQQPPEYEPVERMITKHIRTNHIPGMQVAITHGQEVDYLQVFGSAGEDRVMSVETPMFIASLSKPVTALAVMQLVEAGEIELDAPVRTYIPWFEVADPDVSGRITVRHLLYQTSGLSDLGYMPELPSDASIEDAVRALRRAEPTAEPGERFMYFNSNYTILGLIIETVSGQSYSDYMREHVFQPLGMGHTYTSLELAQSAGLAQGNLAVFGLPVPRREEFRNFDLPSGFILSTASDMSHFVIAQVNGGRYRDAQVLSPEGIALMHQPNPDTESPYAMG